MSTQLVYVNRRKKLESGQRTTSLHWMLNKPGLIGSVLSKVKPENRELYFMLGQFGKCSQDVSVHHAHSVTSSKAMLSLQMSPLSLFSMTLLSGQVHTSCLYLV
jgi:hypothetical protein